MNTRTLLAALVLATLPALAAAQAAKAPAQSSTVPIGQVALVTGSVTVSSGAGTRALSRGDALFEGQALVVGPNSYASLKFNDGGRVLLRPDTEFIVESFRYAGSPQVPPPAAAAAQTSAGTAFFRLVRGGFRAVTGLIGKADRQSYRVTTPAATIGIRGTDYEVQICTSDCPSRTGKADSGAVEVAANDLAGLELAQAGGDGAGGVIVATHDGSVVVRTPRGELVIDVGQVALALANGESFRLPAVPDALLLQSTPSPEACE